MGQESRNRSAVIQPPSVVRVSRPTDPPRILLVTSIVPHPYNRSGPSQLVHDLMRHHPGVRLDMLLYADSQALGDLAHLDGFVERRWISRPQALPALRFLMSDRLTRSMHPPPTSIPYGDYDAIWLYPSLLYPDFRNVSDKVVMSGMDSTTLLYARSLRFNPTFGPHKYLLLLAKSIALESSVKRGHLVHLVGQADLEAFRGVNRSAQSFYLKHPVDVVRGEARRGRPLQPGQVALGFSGTTSPFYCGDWYQRLFRRLEAETTLHGRVSLSFLGPGWASYVESMRKAGFACQHTSWIERYEDFLDMIDAQVLLVQVGAGTKGKALAAAARGAAVIGTTLALENVGRADLHSTVRNVDEVIHAIHQMLDRPGTFFARSAALSEVVRSEHAAEPIAEKFWGIVLEYILR